MRHSSTVPEGNLLRVRTRSIRASPRWRTRRRSRSMPSGAAEPGSAIPSAVAGAGPIGLLAVQLARILGASEVVALDIVAAEARTCHPVGGRRRLTTADEAIAAHPDGFDVVIETTGVNPGEEAAVRLAGRHGRVGFIGIPNAPVTLLGEGVRPGSCATRSPCSGSWNSFSAPFPGAEWTTVVNLFASGQLRGIELITDEVGVERSALLPRLADRSEFHLKALVFPK